ncbi:3-deoxy-manno-octulosonate cytidylyltransferase [Marinomonas posidonica]|uniref:3-deoxy-manno-octulosonate cytidylyltransferase n=1 Tax=Marinomonas posidonica (strain CECT 7376 / NCIMB 14433 / IVIA-Po-181) TaxID=491952 RepID=F6CYS0_MARPP|nr:3-deoxy-manno-octulosonate cytidylyltransferase [Marinomonas posidonica]AEF55752.1 3-deoxy-manno-octulosonate cytidylyltransferase [Marinomonas posidonica IVIA-Po-181]
MSDSMLHTRLPAFHIVIPARYASQRFPQKLMADLGGKPVLQWVHELSRQAGAQSVTVATDHKDIYCAAQEFGANVVMTRDDHENGTERLAEVAKKMAWSGDEIIVNVQGDEPFLPVALIHASVQALHQDVEAEMATVACAIDDMQDYLNPNVVKVVCDDQQRALYFSRAPIPWDRDGLANDHDHSGFLPADLPVLRHIGLYVYRASLLNKYAELPMSPLERWEKLEQLRFLHQGIKVQVAIADSLPSHGVDTPEDLEKLRHQLSL